MQKIKLYYKGNLRYLLFYYQGRQYLLDRSPKHFLGYVCLPLNWYFYQKVYAISDEELVKIEEKNAKASKFILPTSLAAGLAVFVNAWARMNHIDLFTNFYVNFSIVTSLLLVVIGLLLSFGLLQILYSNKKKDLEKLLNRSFEQSNYYKIKPVNSLRFYVKMLLLRLCFFALALIFALAFIYIKNVAMLLMMILTMFIFLASINVAFVPGEEREYEIVDVRSNNSKN